MKHSTKRVSRGKRKASRPNTPQKPYEGPPRDSGRWAKKISGKLHFFERCARTERGTLVPVDDVAASTQAALEKLNQQWPYLKEGRTPF